MFTITKQTAGQRSIDVRRPGADMVVLEQVGHIPHIEDAGAFNEVLLTFLSKQRS